MNDELKFKENLAKNLIKYRKANNLTQLELANILHYSDKAISKWERGESQPDLYTLKVIAEYYNIKIDDLIGEEIINYKPSKNILIRHILITILSSITVWFVFTLVYVLLSLLTNIDWLWMFFIVAIVAFFIVLTVFSCLWFNNLTKSISITGLCWGSALFLQLLFKLLGGTNTGFVYIAGAAFQVLIIIWFTLKHLKKHNKA